MKTKKTQTPLRKRKESQQQTTKPNKTKKVCCSFSIILVVSAFDLFKMQCQISQLPEDRRQNFKKENSWNSMKGKHPTFSFCSIQNDFPIPSAVMSGKSQKKWMMYDDNGFIGT